ncbi:tetratricopeptide repeat protein, partial [Candidatus Sumerlaeota bacterium]|nr:tetratricopeptide repeat protein [Candidatus Sumerlaeota bacterium]
MIPLHTPDSPPAPAAVPPPDPTTDWETDAKDGFKAYDDHNYALAESKLTSALEKTSPKTGDQRRISQILAKLGDLNMQQMKYTDAEPYYLRALEMMGKVDAEGLEFAEIKNNLGLSLYKQNRYAEAEPQFKTAVEIWEGKTTESLLTAKGLNNLAALYKSQERYDEALPLYERSMKIKEQLLEKDDPSFAAGYFNIGQFFESKGDLINAGKNYHQAL